MNDLLCDVYACAEAPERWRAVLDSVCDRISVRSAVVQVIEYRDGRYRRVWEARDSYSLANRERHDRILNNDENPRLRSMRPRDVGSGWAVVRDEDMFPAGSAELAAMKARLSALELGPDLRGMTELAQGRYLALVVHRTAADPRPMGAEDEMLISSLLPHIRQSLRLADQLHGARRRAEWLARANEMIGVGVLLCRPDGRVSWANTAAQSVLARSPYLTARGGRLHATSTDDRSGLERLLVQAGEGGTNEASPQVQLTLGRRDLGEMVQVVAAGPYDSATAPGEREILLLLCQPGRPLNISPEGLSEMFGLSGAEARLTAGLCRGLSVADYARSRGVSVGTARVQLKRAMAKTDSPRQSDLVRRACASLAATLAVAPPDALEPVAARPNRVRRDVHGIPQLGCAARRGPA